jgi:hypothetical protein
MWFQFPFFVYEKNEKLCWNSGYVHVIKWGYQNGKSRFQCKDFGIYFSWPTAAGKQAHCFAWFKK